MAYENTRTTKMGNPASRRPVVRFSRRKDMYVTKYPKEPRHKWVMWDMNAHRLADNRFFCTFDQCMEAFNEKYFVGTTKCPKYIEYTNWKRALKKQEQVIITRAYWYLSQKSPVYRMEDDDECSQTTQNE